MKNGRKDFLIMLKSKGKIFIATATDFLKFSTYISER